MGAITAIQWCDHTFNPWRGCAKVAAGCTNCYAEALSVRNPGVLGVWGEQGTRVVASEAMWRQPLQWDRQAQRDGVRRRVFCASLADVFEDRGDLVAPRTRLFALIDRTKHLDWLLLTKRPENVWQMWPMPLAASELVGIDDAANVISNVWLGTSVATQADAARNVPALLKYRSLAPVLFVSAEPLIERVDLSPWLPQLDWLIVGGESGTNARRCNLAWIRKLRDQCQAAGVPYFVKQVGRRAGLQLTAVGFKFRDPKGGDPAEWPEDLHVREFPARG